LVLDQRSVLFVLFVGYVVVLFCLFDDDLVVHLVLVFELRVPRNVQVSEAFDQLVQVFVDLVRFLVDDLVGVEVRLLQFEAFDSLCRPEDNEVFSPLRCFLA